MYDITMRPIVWVKYGTLTNSDFPLKKFFLVGMAPVNER
jgi:hypothetical protein